MDKYLGCLPIEEQRHDVILVLNLCCYIEQVWALTKQLEDVLMKCNKRMLKDVCRWNHLEGWFK